MGASTYTVAIAGDKKGSRLDRALADGLPELSRTRVRTLIEDGRVKSADGAAACDPAMRVAGGEIFVVEVPAPPPIQPRPELIPLAVVYEDEHLMVVDKPAGLVVHPGAGNPEGTLVNALLAHCPDGLSSIGAPLRPGIVHRLDKETSGLLVVAKTDAAHLALAEQFATHSVARAYQAIVWGNPSPPVGRISWAIGRSASDRRKMAARSRGGKRAVTDYRVIKACGTRASLVECRLQTGRTHQIRVHMASRNHPLVGDASYGGRTGENWTELAKHLPAAGFPRHALHAFLIGFRHPIRPAMIRFCSPTPLDFRQLVNTLEAL